MYLFVLIFGIILLSGCTDSSSDGSPTAKSISVPDVSPNEQSINEHDVANTNKNGATTEVKETLYSMNENIKVDYLTYEVIKAEEFSAMGTSISNKKTEGKFVKVYLKITNDAKETKNIFTPRFKIEDNKGRKYDRLSDDIIYVADYLEFGKQLQPGLATSGAIVFEMPKDAEELKLIITGDWLSNAEVKIKLSTIKDIIKDTTLKEKQDQILDEAMKESEKKVDELMNSCNAPFKCTSSCPKYSDVGQKDCPIGKICCMK